MHDREEEWDNDLKETKTWVARHMTTFNYSATLISDLCSADFLQLCFVTKCLESSLPINLLENVPFVV